MNNNDLNIIYSILQINTQNLQWYGNSKYPEIIKNFVYEHRAKKILKTIDKINKLTALDMDTLLTYFNKLYYDYPESEDNIRAGHYRSCIEVSIVDIDDDNYSGKVYSATFQQRDTENNNIIVANFRHTPDKRSRKIKYCIVGDNGSTLGTFYDKFKDIYYVSNNTYDSTFNSSVAENKKDHIRAVIFDTVKTDIMYYLKDRIYPTMRTNTNG